MASSKMKRLLTVGRFRLYYAERSRFAYPGVVLWTGRDHVRLLPLPRK
jgi:hypothetical protein